MHEAAYEFPRTHQLVEKVVVRPVRSLGQAQYAQNSGLYTTETGVLSP
jgi:hypothetical protein